MSRKNTKPESSDQIPADMASPGGASAAPQAAVVVDLSPPAIRAAIAQGKAAITEGKSKADAARLIFAAIGGESKEVIVAAFVEGAALTPKGALTYWYNCRRRATKQAGRPT